MHVYIFIERERERERAYRTTSAHAFFVTRASSLLTHTHTHTHTHAHTHTHKHTYTEFCADTHLFWTTARILCLNSPICYYYSCVPLYYRLSTAQHTSAYVSIRQHTPHIYTTAVCLFTTASLLLYVTTL
jgi:hypothetical protein